jgi:hypothetical protein
MAIIKNFLDFINRKNNQNLIQIKANNFINPMLIYANVVHQRNIPKINKFLYKVFYICFDISKINSLSKNFFSINKFNILSFYQKDHGKRDGSNIESWIRNLLIERNLNDQVKRIFLFTHPRILGYVFNPVSFWFCVDEDHNLRAVLFEVNNTFNQYHSYLVYNENHEIINHNQWFECDKKFYVSPFFEIIGKYKFRVNFSPNKIAVWIDYFIEGEKNLLTSVTSYEIFPYTESRIAPIIFKSPLLIFKVIFLIHWQALKLFLKKIKFVTNPNKISKNISTNHEKF